jgi:DNA polymerase-3 subunit epsilon
MEGFEMLRAAAAEGEQLGRDENAMAEKYYRPFFEAGKRAFEVSAIDAFGYACQMLAWMLIEMGERRFGATWSLVQNAVNYICQRLNNLSSGRPCQCPYCLAIPQNRRNRRMSLICFMDTEYHLLDKQYHKKDADDPNGPRLASLGWILCDQASMEVRGMDYKLVYPEGWTMTQGAYETNKLDMDTLKRFGFPIASVIAAWADVLELGKGEELTVVAHGVTTDLKVLRGELRRAGLPDFYETTYSFCTMMSNTKLLGLKQGDTNRPKWPSLQECFKFYFDMSEIPGAHTAFNDALALKKLYIEMRSRKQIDLAPKEPRTGGRTPREEDSAVSHPAEEGGAASASEQQSLTPLRQLPKLAPPMIWRHPRPPARRT